MHIIHMASEMAPLAKVGGLGDVILGLSRELSWKGHDVDVIIPKYDCMDSEQVRDLHIEYSDLMSYFQGEWFRNTVWMGWVENLKVYFIEAHHPKLFFNRGCIYGCDDDIDRYLYFSRVALEFMLKRALTPDILHLHDWQAAFTAVLYQDMYQQLGFNKPKTVFTIHNIEYQGKCGPNDLDKVGVEGKDYLVPSKLQDPVFPETINLLKGAIVYADAVTTVSPSYSREVLTPEGGRGLDGVLKQYLDKFQGILNGVDYSYWNPEIDRFLPTHFSSRELPRDKKDHNTLDKKAYIKKLLREKTELAEMHCPIVATVTRLVPQKGLELIKYALKRTLEMGGQFVLLGSGPISSINNDFLAIKQHFADNAHVHLSLHHQEELAHLIYAGSDIFIVPSLFEPCGLTQLIALKYGSVPIVRRTGGLADTIFDVDTSGLPFEETNGYAFDNPDNAEMDAVLRRAFRCWFEHPDTWRKLMIQSMNVDYSWNKPSDQYVEIYKKLTNRAV